MRGALGALLLVFLVVLLLGCAAQTPASPPAQTAATSQPQTQGQVLPENVMPNGQAPTGQQQMPGQQPGQEGAIPGAGGNVTPGGPGAGGTIAPGGQGQMPGQQPSGPASLAFRVNPDAPMPGQPQGVPEGKWMSAQMGEVKVRYFSTAIARGMMESGTDYFITLNNTGNGAASVCMPACCEELRSTVPSWNLHFFALQDGPIELAPGEARKLWYFASLDSVGTFTVNFRMWQCGNEAQEIKLPVVFGSTEESFRGNETSYIEGTVKDEEGKPVAKARVAAVTGCGRVNFDGESDASGKYVIPLLGMEDVEAIYLGRDLACTSKEYWVSVEMEGYEYYYEEGVGPTREKPAKLDIVLKSRKESAEYELKWEKQVQDNYGFFWVKPSDDWSVFAAAQAKHPPELNKPTNIYLFDGSGNVLWKQATGNECWGIDVAKDGSKVVAGCHDGKIYVVSRAGALLWSYDAGQMVRTACFSPDGRQVLSGGLGTILFDASTGARTDVARSGDWMRNCAFYQDGSGFVVGARETKGFDSSGRQQWKQVIGEFPLFLGVDAGGNTYASGKSRTFFSFDADGKTRWTRKIAEPTVTAGAVAKDAGRIAAGSIGGSVYLFDEGGLLWKRGAVGFGEEFSAVGHNAIAISEDGTRVVAGTDTNCVVVYDEEGTILWKECIEPDESNKELKMGVTNVQISPDKKRIIAAYGDNYVRMFELKE